MRYVVHAGYGILPLGYGKLGSDGAKFAVVVQEADGSEREVWSHILDPKARPEERPLQRLDVEFDVSTTARVLLRTLTEPSGRREGDLAFWTAVEVARKSEAREGAER